MRRHRRQLLTYSETYWQLTVSQRRLLATTVRNLRPTSSRTVVVWSLSSRHWSLPTTQQAMGQQRGQSDCWSRPYWRTFSRQSTVACAYHCSTDLLMSCCGTGTLRMVWHEEHQQSCSWNVKWERGSVCWSQIWAKTSKLNIWNISSSTTEQASMRHSSCYTNIWPFVTNELVQRNGLLAESSKWKVLERTLFGWSE